MSTDKKELWLIVSPDSCKRVHELEKPEHVYIPGEPLWKNYDPLDFEDKLREYEEAERTLKIHPDCLVIKEGDEVCNYYQQPLGFYLGCKSNTGVVSLPTDKPGFAHITNRDGAWEVLKAGLGKFPLNSIWHGEEREGKIWLTDKI